MTLVTVKASLRRNAAIGGYARVAVWDDETWHILASQHVKLARRGRTQ